MGALPAKVQLHEKFQARGLDVITVNIEGEEGMEPALVQLKKRGITTTNWCLAEAMSDEVIETLQFESVPALNVYDRQGRLRKTIIGDVDHEELDSLIEQLLSEA